VKKNQFREDLYYRLNAFTIEIPPLRQRKEDIPDLIEYFISNSQWGGERFEITTAAMDLLTQYDWPGNIRELKNCLERALLISSGKIGPDDFPSKFMDASSTCAEKVDFQTLKEAGEWGARQEEEKLIRSTLRRTGGVRSDTAHLLGIDVKTLYNKMKKYGITPFREKQSSPPPEENT
jgi:DNA-binding NtrC family response regulator